MLPGLVVEVNVTVSPVNGSVGDYVKNGLGAAAAGPANASNPARTGAEAAALMRGLCHLAGRNPHAVHAVVRVAVLVGRGLQGLAVAGGVAGAHRERVLARVKA